MEVIIISLVACGASLLTFFSGFGLGTILTPVLIFFFPIETAIALTGIVHFLNNVFKFGLTWKHVHWQIAIKFCSTAIICAWLGSKILLILGNGSAIYQYQLWGSTHSVTWIKIFMGVLLFMFIALEIHPKWSKITFSEDKIYFGGALSGFFGGLAGLQGALRSMFLLKCGLNKEAYIATGIFIACMIDITRLSTYLSSDKLASLSDHATLLSCAVSFAFIGAFLGSKLLVKVTIENVQKIVAVLLTIIGILLLTGVL